MATEDATEEVLKHVPNRAVVVRSVVFIDGGV